jgi:hypothetical protein
MGIPWIFVHPPQTGGTSVRRVIGWDFQRNTDKEFAALLPKVTRNVHIIGDYIHTSASILRERFKGKEWDEAYKFGIVRNPFDRVVSMYHHEHVETRGLKEYGKRLFKQWLIDYKGDTSFDFLYHLRPYTCWDIFSDGENIILDDVYEFETFFFRWSEVCQKLGVPNTPIRHDHRSTRKPYQGYYDDESREFVAQYFKKDLEYWHYGF